MRTCKQMFLIYLLILIGFGVEATNKDKIKGNRVISDPIEDNVYIAGSRVTIDAVIGGDLTAAGWTIRVNDSVQEDLLLAGGDIHINGVIGDDAKVAGRDIRVSRNVHGDLIVSGASVQIDKDVEIDKNLIIFAGEVLISGTVKGNINVSGGIVTFDGTALQELGIQADELIMNGSIHGPATFVGSEVEIGEDMEFKDDVSYWREQGELDLTSFAKGAVIFDEELDPDKKDTGKSFFGLGRITFWLLYGLSVALVMLVLVTLFNKTFQKSGEQINHPFIRNFGYGILYFFGLLVITLLSFLLVIGIPIGLVTLIILAFSLLFANAISSMVIAHGLNIRYEKNWGK